MKILTRERLVSLETRFLFPPSLPTKIKTYVFYGRGGFAKVIPVTCSVDEYLSRKRERQLRKRRRREPPLKKQQQQRPVIGSTAILPRKTFSFYLDWIRGNVENDAPLRFHLANGPPFFSQAFENTLRIADLRHVKQTRLAFFLYFRAAAHRLPPP